MAGEAMYGLLGNETVGAPGLRELADAQSRWRTCLIPPRAQAELAVTYRDAYDAGFWFGGDVPAAPAYAQALAERAYCKGAGDAVAAGADLTF